MHAIGQYIMIWNVLRMWARHGSYVMRYVVLSRLTRSNVLHSRTQVLTSSAEGKLGVTSGRGIATSYVLS